MPKGVKYGILVLLALVLFFPTYTLSTAVLLAFVCYKLYRKKPEAYKVLLGVTGFALLINLLAFTAIASSDGEPVEDDQTVVAEKPVAEKPKEIPVVTLDMQEYEATTEKNTYTLEGTGLTPKLWTYKNKHVHIRAIPSLFARYLRIAILEMSSRVKASPSLPVALDDISRDSCFVIKGKKENVSFTNVPSHRAPWTFASPVEKPGENGNRDCREFVPGYKIA